MPLDAENTTSIQYSRHKAHRKKSANTINGQDREFEGIRTARDLMATEPKPAIQCVAERIPSGLVVLGGRPKSKKSWMALQISIAMAASSETLGKLVKKQR